jgi:hypothetical protein
MSVTRWSTVFFLSFLAAIFVELEKGRREEVDGKVLERAEEVREERKDWRSGETICRMELCVDAMLELCGRMRWNGEVLTLKLKMNGADFLVEFMAREACASKSRVAQPNDVLRRKI